MGLASSSMNKVTLDQKLQYLETKIIKQCNYHRKQGLMFCAIPNCDKCPYLCQDCIRQGVHQHQQGIYYHNEFLKAIVSLIQAKKIQQNQVLQASVAQKTIDYSNIYKEETKLLEHIDILQSQIATILAQLRVKLQQSLERLGKKLNKTYQVKNPNYINFYSNPNILACKLASERGDKFLLQLKNQLRSVRKKTVSSSNQQQQLSQFRIQIGNAKTKIRDLLNVTNISHFAKKNSMQISNIGVTLKKTFLVSPDCPNKMLVNGSNINILTPKEVYAVDMLTKQNKKILGQSLTLLSSRKQGEQFVGVSQNSKQTKLLVFDGRTINQMPLMTKISGLNLLKHKRKLYGLVGQQEGIFNIIDLEQNKSAFFYRCGDQPVCHIQVSQQNSTICCGGRKTSIYMFKYKPKFAAMNDIDQLQFEYILQMNINILPQGELNLMRINNSQLYLFGPNRNIVVYDLMLNSQIIRTENTRKSNQFIQAEFATINGTQCLLTLNEKQDTVSLCQIDKIKRSIKVQELLREKTQRPIISIACSKNELWVIRENQKNIDIFSFNAQ